MGRTWLSRSFGSFTQSCPRQSMGGLVTFGGSRVFSKSLEKFLKGREASVFKQAPSVVLRRST